MDTNPTPLAIKIFSNIQALDRTAVFLAVRDQGRVLSAGPSRSTEVTCRVFLHSAGVDLLKCDNCEFVILMDGRGANGSPRLVMYHEGASDPVVEYDRDVEGYSDLVGSVFVTGREPNGNRILVVHAIFNGQKGGSLLIDSSPTLQRHLNQCTLLTGGRE